MSSFRDNRDIIKSVEDVLELLRVLNGSSTGHDSSNVDKSVSRCLHCTDNRNVTEQVSVHERSSLSGKKSSTGSYERQRHEGRTTGDTHL